MFARFYCRGQFLVGLAILSTIGLFGNGAPGQAASEPLLPNRSVELIGDFDAFGKYLTQTWANRKPHESLDHFQLEDRISSFKMRFAINPPSSEQEVYLALEELVNRLHDGHLRAIFPHARMTSRESEMTFALSNDSVRLVACKPSCKTVNLPAVVSRFDDVDAMAWIKAQSETATGSTFEGREHQVLRWLSVYYEGLVGERKLPTTITLVPQGSHKSITLPFQWKVIPVFPARDFAHCVSSKMQGETLVIRVATFQCGLETETRELMIDRFREQMNRAFALKKPYQSILLDLRGNPGGFPDEANLLMSHFLRKPILYYRGRNLAGPTGGLNPDSTLYDTMVSAPSKAPYASEVALHDLPLWLLIDGGCFSQCAMVAFALRDSERAKTVGSPINSGAGGSIPWEPPSHLWKAFVPTWEIRRANHEYLDGAELPLDRLWFGSSVSDLPSVN